MTALLVPPKPYFLRAYYDWIVDVGYTPYVLVDVSVRRVKVPEKFVQNGYIVLNISPDVVSDLRLGKEAIQFSARFGGVQHPIYLPLKAVTALYAKEDQRGMCLRSAAYWTDEPEPVLEPGFTLQAELPRPAEQGARTPLSADFFTVQ